MSALIRQLKQHPQFWSNPEFRNDVLTLEGAIKTTHRRLIMPELRRARRIEIVKEVLTAQEQLEALTAEFQLLNL